MSIIALLDVQPGNVGEFLDLNAIAHETIFNAFLSRGVVFTHYPMWSDAPDNDWLELHFQEHQSWSLELGLPAPPDLRQLNVDDAAVRQAWLYNHALHHNVVSVALGL